MTSSNASGAAPRRAPLPASTGTPAVYLIVLEDVLVAMDLTETIRDFAPGAVVLTCNDATAAESLLLAHSALVLAFVALGPTQYGPSGLAREVSLRGGAVVLMGDMAEESPSGEWPVLSRPFSRETVQEHLRMKVA